MLRFLLPALLSTLFVAELYAQNEHKIDFALSHAIQRNPENEFKIGISFHDNVDLDSLKHFFKTNQIPVKQRPAHVIKALQNVAWDSQRETIAYLKSNISPDKIHALWIVNRIIVELEPRGIYEIAGFRDVKTIEWERAEFLPITPVKSAPVSSERSPGGIEPGLIAINAPAMWKMGYTGRGTLLYNYDTGVWADHPAFSARYLGYRYPHYQSWYGYFRDFPNGLTSDHGTHTLGTMAGLVEETQDTIGAAFGAYWIANDLIVSSVEDILPIEEMAYAFEWALNPDGDINTGHDVPDVINNSWGRPDDQMTEQCDSWISDLLTAIEAAGIANVFSGGNDGPNNSGVGLVQSINTSVVNTFSVGSVDANQPVPYPISNFSSRGPTQCPGEGSLKIHPQVVAPGQNVRSAWGIDSYSTISGTSMAAPHVSGAILLLKEAFPYLSGEELLWALYHSAIDYGEPGEDNVFGNGLIDVKAAFDLLSLEYDPVDPTAVPFDLVLTVPEENQKLNTICDDKIEAKVLIDNLGQNTPDSIRIAYWFTGSEDTIRTVIQGMVDSFETGPLMLDEYGEYTLNFELVHLNPGFQDYDPYNNRSKINYIRSLEKHLPFEENFETGINDSIWILENPDFYIGWDTFPVSGIDGSDLAATLQFFNYSPRAGQKDGLLLSNVLLDQEGPIYLSYDYAYQPFFGSTTIRDTFRIFILNDCDRSNPILLKEAAGPDLYVSDSIFINFKPKFPGHWKQDSIDLSAYQDQRISILFEGTNMKWNNLYIDNISIGNQTTRITEDPDREERFTLYPNPANHSITLEIKNGDFSGELSLSILNVTGKILLSQKINSKKTIIDLAEFETGIYFVVFTDGREWAVKRMIKTR
jgi:bacillopeptidase F